MKVGIAIDSWKLPVFERHLKRAGFTYEPGPGIASGTLMLYITSDDIAGIRGVAEQAGAECAKKGSPDAN